MPRLLAGSETGADTVSKRELFRLLARDVRGRELRVLDKVVHHGLTNIFDIVAANDDDRASTQVFPGFLLEEIG